MRSSVIEAEPRILVIGYGNSLRGDDGIGPAAAEILARRLPASLASVMSVHQLTPELAQPLSQAKLVIFIDADCKSAPGKIHHTHLAPCWPEACSVLGHCVEPQALLRLAGDLYGNSPVALIFTVGAAELDFRPCLSRQVKKSLPALVKSVISAIRSFDAKKELNHA